MMNSKVEKDFEDFLFSGREMDTLEMALFSLLDKYKSQVVKGRTSMGSDTESLIKLCMEKLKLHENFAKNKKYFDISLKKYDEYDTDGTDKVA